MSLSEMKAETQSKKKNKEHGEMLITALLPMAGLH